MKWVRLPDKVLKCVLGYICPYMVFKGVNNVLDVLGGFVKIRCFKFVVQQIHLILLYSGCMLTETAATSEMLACAAKRRMHWDPHQQQ